MRCNPSTVCTYLETFCHWGSLEWMFSFPQYPDLVRLGQETLQGQQPWRRCLFMQERGRGGSRLQPRAAQAPGSPSLLRQRFTGLPLPQDSTWCFFKSASAEQLSWGLVFAAETEITEPGRCHPCLYTDLRVNNHPLGWRATLVLFPLCKLPGCSAWKR